MWVYDFHQLISFCFLSTVPAVKRPGSVFGRTEFSFLFEENQGFSLRNRAAVPALPLNPWNQDCGWYPKFGDSPTPTPHSVFICHQDLPLAQAKAWGLGLPRSWMRLQDCVGAPCGTKLETKAFPPSQLASLPPPRPASSRFTHAACPKTGWS